MMISPLILIALANAAGVMGTRGEFGDFPNTIWQAPSCEELSSRLLVVYTRTEEQKTRSIIHNKMTAALQELNVQDKYSILFPVGVTKNCSDVSHGDSELRRLSVQEEEEERCDYVRGEESGYRIIGGEYEDRYDTLYNKSGSVLNYASTCVGHFRWLIKVDEDMTVHYLALDRYLNALDTLINSVSTRPKYWWLGMEWKNLLVLSTGPNAEPSYPAYSYPPFMSGPFYIMSDDTAEILYNEMKHNKTVYRNEDAMMGVFADNLRTLRDPAVDVLSLDQSQFIINHLGKWMDDRVCPRYDDLDKPDYDHAVPCHCEKTIAFPNVRDIDDILNRNCGLDFNWSAYWSSVFQDTLHYF